ncbi:ribose ABC transporter [Halomonas sp. EGI 63088]|uniref:Ribose ABC transporter n=1 Tax=Halomonas flagellata TaxID=2920385 RepID=A0ABS9RWX3_9GAMM|nr:RbsD/FucU domain-containing protein [Halomonas flagellata]MCH4564351.1 ribose ABC transporter [Halomonas flagellata]
MLKNIDTILTGDLLSILRDMGHGDEIVITDSNFPAATVAQRLVRLPGIPADRVLEAILSVLPLDDFVEAPAITMAAPDGRPPVCDDFDRVMAEAEGGPVNMEQIDRFDFYERAKKAYAVVSTGERRLYANLILKKGVLRGGGSA